jgi:hypothetical protein
MRSKANVACEYAMPFAFVTFFKANLVTTALDLRPLDNWTFTYFVNALRLPVGNESKSGNISPSRSMYTRRRFLHAFAPFSPVPN